MLGFGEWVDKFGLGSLSIFNKGSQKHDQQQQRQHRHVVQPSIEQGIFSEKRISATIVGYEILHHQEKYAIFKIRVDNLSEWSVDTVPVWHIFRRYSEMLTLFQKIRTSFPLHPFEFPPRKWLGNQFDPLFLGRRIQRLQGFLSNVLDDPEVRDHEIVRHFFCFDAPPNRTSIPLEFDRAIFDTFEEVVHELREQLRAREILEATTHDQREMLKERDLELDVMRTEIDTLRRQKDSLLKALG
ncbi:hypothetical protein TCAL_07871 [Tigriopus californicus]|uniref:PX domain-containing protein n=1 Tax=Tigriopus californicus TaxID=6832 RepID=A0A553N6G3_TIGCA|nr:hypothetical protein TCAL_07871 [Tigriopus californicus]